LFFKGFKGSKRDSVNFLHQIYTFLIALNRIKLLIFDFVFLLSFF